MSHSHSLTFPPVQVVCQPGPQLFSRGKRPAATSVIGLWETRPHRAISGSFLLTSPPPCQGRSLGCSFVSICAGSPPWDIPSCRRPAHRPRPERRAFALAAPEQGLRSNAEALGSQWPHVVRKLPDPRLAEALPCDPHPRPKWPSQTTGEQNPRGCPKRGRCWHRETDGHSPPHGLQSAHPAQPPRKPTGRQSEGLLLHGKTGQEGEVYQGSEKQDNIASTRT